ERKKKRDAQRNNYVKPCAEGLMCASVLFCFSFLVFLFFRCCFRCCFSLLFLVFLFFFSLQHAGGLVTVKGRSFFSPVRVIAACFCVCLCVCAHVSVLKAKKSRRNKD